MSMPLRAERMPKWKTFVYGVLSGLVEPIGSIITILFATQVVPLLPYFLSFAAGAMMYVVVEELIPEMSEGKHTNIGTVLFSLGFVTMMILDAVSYTHLMAECFNIPSIAVDTHVARISRRLGLCYQKDDVEKIERKLMRKIPRDRWIKTHHQMIFFGRYL